MASTAEKHNYFHAKENDSDDEEDDGDMYYDAEHMERRTLAQASKMTEETGPELGNMNQSLKQAYMVDPWNHIWIFFVYVFEYLIITGLFDRLAQLRESHESKLFLEKNLFTITQFLYQAGVLLARSSLYFMKFKKTGLLVIILSIHFLVFFYFCLYDPFISKYVIFLLAFSVGIFGGWGYLFCYFRCLDNVLISSLNREKLINYMAVSADIGALVATGLATLLSQTILRID